MTSNSQTDTMNCRDFEHWLACRDIHDPVLPRGALDHLAVCRTCETLFNHDLMLEKTVKKGCCLEELPQGLADHISLSLEHEVKPGSSRFLWPLGAALAGLAIFLVLALTAFEPKSAPRFKDLNQVSLQAVKDHLAGNRHMSFEADRLDQALDILTRDLGFKVLLPDLAQYGCVLLGGRICALGDCRAAYFILDRDGRTGSLFVMDSRFLNFDMADGSRFTTRAKGCEACVWKENGQIYAMVF